MGSPGGGGVVMDTRSGSGGGDTTLGAGAGRHSSGCLTSAGGVPQGGRGLGQSLVYDRIRVFGQVDRGEGASA